MSSLYRTIVLLCVLALCMLGEHRIVKLVPFGDNNLKIIFANPIDGLEIDTKYMQESKGFIDIEAVLTIPRRNFIFKDNSSLQIAQNTPQVVRLVFSNIAPKSAPHFSKDKENLYITMKPKNTKSIKDVFSEIEAKNPNTNQNTQKDKANETQKVSAQLDSKTKEAHKQIDSKNTNTAKTDTNKTQGTANTNTQSVDSKTKQTTQNQDKNKNKNDTTTATNTQKQQEKARDKKTTKYVGKGRKIVVDAGHGGKDCGAKSVENQCEKVIVLDVAKFLAQELKNRGYVVHMTRNSDVYIDLRKRTEFANTKNADLFVSVHANSIPKTSAKTRSGVETYFLSPARSERAEQVAKAENQGDIETMSHFATKSFLNTISAHHLVASHKLAIEIQFGILSSVRPLHNTQDGAVREGPFWVLAGALMPSVLIEIGYLSHKEEGKLLAKKEYQKLLAHGIANGIDGYFIRNY